MDIISIFMKLLKISPHPEDYFCEELYAVKDSTGKPAYLSVTGSKTEICMCFWDALCYGKGNILFIGNKHKGRIGF